MTVVYGPAETVVPGGTTVLPTLLYTATLKRGDQLIATLPSATPDPGVTRSDYDGFMVRDGSYLGPAAFNPNTLWSAQNVRYTYTIVTDGTYFVTVQGGGQPKDSSHGVVHGYQLELITAAIVHCQFGTELKAPGTFIYYVTPGLIDVALAEIGQPWMAPLFTGFYFSTIDAGALCSDGPPVPDPVDSTIWTAGLTERLEWLRAVLWNHFCQCKPGTPAPTPFPPPNPVQPPGGPTQPTFPCDPAQLCATLVQIQQQLAAVSQTLGQDYALDTLVQRYQSPFAVIHGAVHSNVSTSGTFAVSRLIGVQVEVQESPPTNQTFSGVPTYVSDLGWLSILTGDGLIDEIRLTRSLQIWLPRLMPLATQFGISLREGVTVRITELEAEP